MFRKIFTKEEVDLEEGFCLLRSWAGRVAGVGVHWAAVAVGKGTPGNKISNGGIRRRGSKAEVDH